MVAPDGQFLGTILALIKLDYLSNRITSSKIGQTGYALAIDDRGFIIAHSNKELVLVRDLTKEKGMESIVSTALNHAAGTEGYVFGGIKKTASFAPVVATGWSIIATQNDSELYAEANKIKCTIAAFVVFFLIVTILVVSFFARGLSARINVIAQVLQGTSNQVAAASAQVASTSQVLASGSSRSASAIQETSASIEELSAMTARNAASASELHIVGEITY